MASERDIAQIVGMISAAYPNFKVTELTTEVYFQTLKDLEAEELKTAVLNCITEAGRAFAPSVGEIRGAVMEMRRSAMNIPTAYEAWRSFLRYVNGGFNEELHPLTRQTVEALGERNLRMSENQTADRARFVECYEQFQKRAEQQEMLLPEVRAYLESHGARLLDVNDSIKQLTKGLSK